MGINEINTIVESNIFQPFLKKSFLLVSLKKRIKISMTKKTVIA